MLTLKSSSNTFTQSKELLFHGSVERSSSCSVFCVDINTSLQAKHDLLVLNLISYETKFLEPPPLLIKLSAFSCTKRAVKSI